MTGKQDIKALSHDELVTLMKELGQPSYRAKQVEDALYAHGRMFISEIDNIPKSLRARLDEDFFVGALELAAKQVSEDGTRKYLFKLPNGAFVETVGIPSGSDRLTVCFSSQAGCPMGCTFCATGKSGFTCNLNAGEMYDQVRLVGEDFDQRVTNVVCMGQGEPFLNYDAVMLALRRMNSKEGLGIGARHITVSTCGVIKGLDRFMQEPEQFTLAVSLHSAVQETRDRLMPGVANVSLEDLKQTIKAYGEATKRRPSIEYAPIEGINDDDAHIDALVSFCKGMLCHVNLIPLNPIESGEDGTRPSSRLAAFENALTSHNIENSIRNSRGKDIDGACGQLRQRVR